MYNLSEAPEGYEWEVKEIDDPMFAGMKGKTLQLVLSKDGKEVEKRGVFVPDKRMDEAQAFIEGMENSIRMGLNS